MLAEHLTVRCQRWRESAIVVCQSISENVLPAGSEEEERQKFLHYVNQVLLFGLGKLPGCPREYFKFSKEICPDGDWRTTEQDALKKLVQLCGSYTVVSGNSS